MNNSEVKEVLQNGFVHKSHCLNIFWLKKKSSYAKIATIVSKKVYPKAVSRNYFKRLQRNNFRKLISDKKDFYIVVVAKRSIAVKDKKQLFTIVEEKWNSLSNLLK